MSKIVEAYGFLRWEAQGNSPLVSPVTNMRLEVHDEG